MWPRIISLGSIAEVFTFGRRIPLTPWRKYPLGAACYWLQLSRIDSEQVEGLGLDRRRRGDQRKPVSVVERGGHLVERAGGKVAHQALEAVDGATIGSDFAGALSQRRG